MAVQTPSFFSFNGPETLFSNNNSVTSTPVPVNIPTNLGGGSQYGSSNVWNPGVGNDPIVTSPTNVGNPFGYGMSNTVAQGTMPSGDDRSAYEKAMADRYASTVVSPGLFGTDIGKQTGYTGQGSAGGRSPSLANSSSAGGAPSGVGGGGYSGAATQQASTAQPLRPQDLSQRALSGSYYSPDMSEYDDSSLFNYTGPGGVDEYTYGQGLPMDGAGYNVWGTPADMVNPYYEGQFAQAPTGVADSAINMSPVVTPDGIPDVSKPTTFPNFMPIPPRPGDSAADLNYAQQIEAMGLTTQTAPSTLFGSPAGGSQITPSTLMAEGSPNGRTGRGYRSGMDSGLLADESGIGNAEQFLSAPQGGLPNPYADKDGMSYNPATGNVELMAGGSPNGRGGRTESDLYYDRNDVPKMSLTPENFTEQDSLGRRVGSGMNDGLGKLMEQGKFLQDKYDAQEAIQVQDNIFNDHFDKNQAEYTPTLSDVSDATPMQFANSAGQMDVANTSIFDANREASVFAKGPKEVQSVFDEQQNYEVPASEMSPGETGLVNGLVEGLLNFGPGSKRSQGEQAAWDKYYDYKNAGTEAVKNGEIDEKAFNELKGKAGSDTVINHFVNKDTSPKINNFMTNSANIFYQAMDVIAGDDSIKDGIVDYYQQKKGVNNDSPIGTIAQELAKAKEATAQRKAEQKNIFTPGPMKFAAVASKPTPAPVKVSKPVRTPVKKAPAPVKASKPTRTPAPTPTRSTGSRGGRGNVAAKKSAPSSYSSSYSRRVGGR